MEQTINLFSKGLQLDTNPMVQSNDTLSDALNATFITQNGNEVVLLNDMGNRRVDNAYLPAGYEPIGIKEYGGIIYIAAYNPITGKSQIGSFPSPERKISKSDDPNLRNTVDFVSDFRGAVKLEYGLCWLTDDTLLYPLTNKNSIHAGDKFVVYGFSNATDTVTNYNNVNENKVITPLNKTYTLQLGVLNSLNEFVDITKTLVRWDANDNKISFDKEVTDLYRFNSGYFLPKGIIENNDLSETINDSNLINERTALKLALNTYAYKLVGPLYLKAILNHIEEFNYDIYGTYESDKKEAELTIDGYITYNCPHELNTSANSIDDEDYITFDDGTIKVRNSNNIEDNVNINSFFDFYYQNLDPEDKGYKLTPLIEGGETIIGETKYNKLTNLYTTKISKKYSIHNKNGHKMISIGETDPTSSEGYSDFLYFIIGVTTPLLEKAMDNLGNYNLEVYLEGLSVVDVINLNLLGSGKVFPREWRFHNDIENGFTKLVYNLNSYPKEGKQFVNLSMELYDVEKNLNNIRSNLPIENWILTDTIHLADTVFNGRVTREINWEGTNIEPRKLYYVRLKWEILDKETGEIEESNGYTNLEEFPIWFLSTPLFNSCFNASNDDFIECYYKPLKGKELTTFNNKQIILLELLPNESKTYDSTNIITDGSIITKTDTNDPYIMTTIHQVRYKLNPKIKIKNENYYPDFIKINDGVENNIASNVNVNYQYLYKGNIYEINEGQNESFNNALIENNIYYTDGSRGGNLHLISDVKEEIGIQQHLLDELFTTAIIFTSRNVFKCSRVSNDTEITNVFDSIENTIEPIIIKLIGGPRELGQGGSYYGGQVVLDYNNDGNTVAKDLGVAVFFFDGSEGCKLENFENIHGYSNKFGCDFETPGLLYSQKPYAEEIYNSNRYNGDNQLGRTVILSTLASNVYDIFNKHFPSENYYYPDFLFLFNNEILVKDKEKENLRMVVEQNSTNGVVPYYYQHFTRVWWRTSDQRWALLKKPLKMPQFGSGSSGSGKGTRRDKDTVKPLLVEYFSKFFTTKFVYCYTEKITAKEAGLYIPIESAYTRPYNFDIQVCVKLLYASALVPNIIDNEGITTPLHFKSDGEIFTLKELDSYTIQSQESFYDIISNLSFNNIYLKTGKSVDIDKKPLDEKLIYIDLNGELVRANKVNKLIANRITISKGYPYNRILYNPSHEEQEYVHDYRYDEDAPSRYVYIDYKGMLTTPETI